jgi:hypothetical protein
MRQDRKPFDCYRETANGNYGTAGMPTGSLPFFAGHEAKRPPERTFFIDQGKF